MKAMVYTINKDNIQDMGIPIEAESLRIGNGVYHFYNTDRSDPQLPFDIMVAVFPSDNFYIIGNE